MMHACTGTEYVWIWRIYKAMRHIENKSVSAEESFLAVPDKYPRGRLMRVRNFFFLASPTILKIVDAILSSCRKYSPMVITFITKLSPATTNAADNTTLYIIK